MTTRHAGYVVTLAKDVREDDAEAVVNALRMVRGVLSVEPVEADLAVHIAEERADAAWRKRLVDLATQRDS